MRKRPVLARLEHHYKRISGELQRMAADVVGAGVAGNALAARQEPETSSRRAMLTQLEACLRLEDPAWSPKRMTPIPPRIKRNPFDRGMLLSMGYDVLREAAQPISTSEILDGMWKIGRLTRTQSQDDEMRAALTTLLRRQERVGAVRSDGKRPLRWSIIKSPNQS